jgi:hypothetical protein
VVSTQSKQGTKGRFFFFLFFLDEDVYFLL